MESRPSGIDSMESTSWRIRELLLLDPRGPELAVSDPVVFGRWLISDQRSAKKRNLALVSLDPHAWYRLFFYCARTRGQAKI